MYRVQTEKEILSTLISSSEKYNIVKDFLDANDFSPGNDQHEPNHRALYNAIVQIYENGGELSLGSLSDLSHFSVDLLEKEYKSELENLEYGLTLLKEARMEREVISNLQSTRSNLNQGIDHFVEEQRSFLKKLERHRIGSNLDQFKASNIAYQLLEYGLEQSTIPLEQRVVRLGYPDLDDEVGGIMRGDKLVIAARPGMGKSAWSADIRDYNLSNGMVVAEFSFEMTAYQVQLRRICKHTGIAMKDLRTFEALLADTTKKQFQEQINDLLKIDNWYLPSVGTDYNVVANTISQLAQEVGVDLVILDYLQLLQTLVGNNRVQEITHITARNKQLALLHNLALIEVAQLNRGVENRENKRPRLSDLKESGSIEQDADMVSFIYRDEYYNPDDTEKPGIAEIDIAKNRHGPTPVRELYWNGPRMTFSSLQKDTGGMF